MKKLSILVVACSLVVGCANNSVKPERSDIDVLLDKQIRTTHSNVQSIYGSAAYEQTVTESNDVKNVNPMLIPTPLKALIDIKWYGEARIVLKDLAASMDGMEFSEKGIKPAHPYDVFLNETKAKVFDVLENIGHQLPSDVLLNVIIDPFDKDNVKVSLQYDEK